MFLKILRFSTFETPHPKMWKMQIWMFQKILRFSFFWSLLPPQNEKNVDLDISEDFKILNISEPIPQNEKNADFDVSEDFKILNYSDPIKNRDLDDFKTFTFINVWTPYILDNFLVNLNIQKYSRYWLNFSSSWGFIKWWWG